MQWKIPPLVMALAMTNLLACADPAPHPEVPGPDASPIGTTRGALYEGCSELGSGMTDHACFHAQFGPFVSVNASAVRVFGAATPNVNPVHTQYTIALPGAPGANEGTVKYRPARSGDWSILLSDPTMSLLVLDAANQPVPLELSTAVSGCSQLPTARVYTLTANATYRFVLGPSAASSVAIVIEKLSDFESFYYADADGDGFGDTNDLFVTACTAPAGRVTDDTDCDDAQASVFPDAPELCDQLDNDCDGEVDDGAAPGTFYRDLDGDGFGDASSSTQSCTAPAGYVSNDDDCNDAAANVNPNAAETCDSADNNCNSLVDEGVTNACGTCGAVPAESCDGIDNNCNGQTDEGVTNACGTCGAAPAETCDGVDNDCDGQVDEGVLNACGGCGAVGSEICDGIDNDCDGTIDEGVTNACGACGALPAEICDGVDNDCDGTVDEGVTNACGTCGAIPAETCDGVDNDCDGSIDEGLLNTYYRDADADGYGDATLSVQACSEPAGYITDATDCDDTSAAVNPEEEEICDSLDNNCDGDVDNLEDPLEHLVEHACEHAEFGPFETVSASAAGTAGPDVSTHHTAFTIVLPGSGANHEGEVTFVADEDNDFAILLDAAVSVSVIDENGVSIPAELDQAVTGCSALAHVSLFELTAGEYRLVFGPTSESNFLMVIEEAGHEEGEPESGAVAFFQDADADSFGNAAASVMACAAPSGYVANDDDCNDSIAAVSPVAPEACDGIDNNCNSQVDEGVLNACGSCGAVGAEICDGFDNDCDGTTDEGVTNACGTCGAVPAEICDGIDNNCNGQTDEGVTNACGICGAVPAEICDGIDNNCNGQTDEGVTNACGICGAVPAETCDGVDNDCDGTIDEGVTNACGTCGALPAETCDGIDNNCNGQTDEGVTNACGACGAVPAETCDGVDNNCDGTIDEGVMNACGACGAVPAETCDGIDNDCDGQTDEGVLNACGSCGAVGAEICDGFDNDCDGTIDEGVTNACGTCGAVPAETCDGVDNDCDGQIDEGLLQTYYRDADADGYGASGVTVQACSEPAGYITDATDCDDANADVNPEAEEICDSLDNNCDGDVDNLEDPLEHLIEHSCEHAQFGPFESVNGSSVGADGPDVSEHHRAYTINLPGAGANHAGEVAFVADEDNDFAFLLDANVSITVINEQGETVAAEADQPVQGCAALAHLTLFELTAGEYRVVFGPTSEADVLLVIEEAHHEHEGEPGEAGLTFFADADNDGFGNAEISVLACSLPTGYAEDDTDCNDSSAASYPGAVEVCDELDNDCDAEIDEDVLLTFWRDADGDGFGDAALSVEACVAPVGYSDNDLDCNDGASTVNPGAAEVCDELDNNCDGEIDSDNGQSACSCEPIELVARRTYNPSKYFDGEVDLDHEARVAIPKYIPLCAGCVTNQSATFKWFDLGRNRVGTCTYRGDTGGQRYKLQSCSFNRKAGDVVRTDWLSLRIDGRKQCGVTQAKLSLPDLSCS